MSNRVQRNQNNDNQGTKERLVEHYASSFLEQSQKIQISYNVTVKAKIKKQYKTILQSQSGLIQDSTFTAILGPSGSGKTTLLNFLSGRLMSSNLTIEGGIRFNRQSIRSVEPYCKQIGYVMQEDALLSTLTPRECFQFAADLRLTLPKQQKQKIVQNLIKELGLTSCADTKVGNNFIKGISGGERKRTSIGVELITNPSIIFLDEPTTGLDSTTALQVILLLKKLAKQGKTVISTIHQPSSQLSCQFDRLMLLVDGRCIFQGPAEDAYGHFEAQGFKCPQLMNASQFYLDMMSITEAEDLQENESFEDAKRRHDEKILKFENFYIESKYHKFEENQYYKPVEVKNTGQISIFYELFLISYRSCLCQLRNPMDVFFKTVQAVFTSVIVWLVFGNIGDANIDDKSQQKLQNIRGVIFFLVASNAFGGMQGTLAVFCNERQVFLRERFSKSYKTITYFIGRTGTNFPFDLIYPSIGLIIIYWATNFAAQTAEEMFKLLFVCNALYFCSSSYGLFYAALIPKLQTAMALIPILIIPFMLLGGFFVNLENYHDVRVIFYPVMYLSPFKYGYQGGMAAVGVNPKYDPRTPDDYLENVFVLIGLGVLLRLVAVGCMQIVSNPKRPKMQKITEQQLSSQVMTNSQEN